MSARLLVVPGSASFRTGAHYLALGAIFIFATLLLVAAGVVVLTDTVQF